MGQRVSLCRILFGSLLACSTHERLRLALIDLLEYIPHKVSQDSLGQPKVY